MTPHSQPGLGFTTRDDVRLLQLIDLALLPLPDLSSAAAPPSWKQEVAELYRQSGERPRDPQAWTALADRLCALQLYKDAAQALDRAVTRDVPPADLIEGMAQALRATPNRLLGLARSWNESGSHQLCILLVDRYLSFPDADPARDALEREKMAAEDYLDRRQRLEEEVPATARWLPIVRLAGGAAVPLLLLWLAYLGWSGFLEERREQGRQTLARARQAAGDARRTLLQSACGNLDFYVRQRPHDPAGLTLCGQANYLLGADPPAPLYLDAAEKALNAAVAEAPEDPAPRLWLGRLYLATGRRPQAREQLDRVVRGTDAALRAEAETELSGLR